MRLAQNVVVLNDGDFVVVICYSSLSRSCLLKWNLSHRLATKHSHEPAECPFTLGNMRFYYQLTQGPCIFYHHNTTIVYIQQARYVSNNHALPQAPHTTRSLVQWCDVIIQHGVSNSNIKQSNLSNKRVKILFQINIPHCSFNNTTEFNSLVDFYFSLPTFIILCHPGINVSGTSGSWWRIFEWNYSGIEHGQIMKFE